ncbi:MAG: class I SAM-dependent methyltransferase [Desulfobacterales bacterium]|jgi:ubiquinone/menaquinone biosynthesis C-methylase UbiE
MQKQRFPQKVQKLREPDRIEDLEIERVVKLSAPSDGYKNVLDIGTGSGLFAEVFSSPALCVTGVDNDPEMVAAAKMLVPDAFFLMAAAEALPFLAYSFNLVFFGLVLHEIDNRLEALQEALRVAQQRVVVLEWPFPRQHESPPKARRFTPEEVRELSQKAGFHHIDIFQLRHFLLYRMDL